VTADRASWLRDRRAAVEAQYDLESPEYESLQYPVPLHARFVDKLIATTPPGALILDAPCGTGKYFAQVAASGRRVVGIDQSAGMLEQARRKGVAEALHHVGLQELAFEEAFDAAMTIDAMENVPPEDWPLVARNLRRALRPGGHLYVTVEELNEPEIEEAHGRQQERGWPSVRGEVIEGDTAGYHYYPGREQAVEWLAAAGFRLLEEDFDRQQGWGYRHFLLATDGPQP
jgi:SAM-dependent methyltransferase